MTENLPTEAPTEAELRNDKRHAIFMVILLIALPVGAVCWLPIWHRHPGLNGMMHGHPIWDWGHIH